MNIDITRKFLRDLWGSMPCYVWYADTKTTVWGKTPNDLIDVLKHTAQGRNVYVGVGTDLTQADNVGTTWNSKKRLKKTEVNFVCAVYADLDVAGPQKSNGKNYPPSKDYVLQRLLRYCSLKPSIVVDTGGGLQAWWLLEDGLVILQNEDLHKIEELLKRWLQYLRTEVLEGYDVDPVHDVSRVLRIAGLDNPKYQDNGKYHEITVVYPEEYLTVDVQRYYARDIEDATKHIQIQTTQESKLSFKNATYKPEIPDIILQAIPRDPTLKLLLETPEKYTSPTLKDKSPSGYRLAMLNQAVKYTTNPDELVSLALWWEVEHKSNRGVWQSKLKAISTLQREIEKVIATSRKLQTQQQLSQLLQNAGDYLQAASEKLLQVAQTTGMQKGGRVPTTIQILDVAKWYTVGRNDDGRWYMTITIIVDNMVRTFYYNNATSWTVKTLLKDLQMTFAVRCKLDKEEAETLTDWIIMGGREVTDKIHEELADALIAYLKQTPAYSDIGRAARDDGYYVDMLTQEVYIRLENFKDWLRVKSYRGLTGRSVHELGAMLRSAGAVKKMLDYYVLNKRIRNRWWNVSQIIGEEYYHIIAHVVTTGLADEQLVNGDDDDNS